MSFSLFAIRLSQEHCRMRLELLRRMRGTVAEELVRSRQSLIALDVQYTKIEAALRTLVELGSDVGEYQTVLDDLSAQKAHLHDGLAGLVTQLVGLDDGIDEAARITDEIDARLAQLNSALS